MRKTTGLAALMMVAAIATAAAQQPGRPAPMRADRSPAAARLFLAHTGALGLTDAQVVRLAAIERRAETRRKALRAAMDSARNRFSAQRPDSATRRQFADRMRADLQRAREQAQTDQRDALAVLTPDQQARAWDLAASRARMGRGAGPMRGRGHRGGQMRAPRGDRMGPPAMDRTAPLRDRRPMRAPRPPIDES